VFDELAEGHLDKARRGLSDIGQCSEVNEASSELRITIMAFKAAAVPFRSRPEVSRTLDALDALTLDEVNGLTCFFEPGERPARHVEDLQKRIDAVAAKLAAIVAACPSP
jgi:hypothetical protein